MDPSIQEDESVNVKVAAEGAPKNVLLKNLRTSSEMDQIEDLW